MAADHNTDCQAIIAMFKSVAHLNNTCLALTLLRMLSAHHVWQYMQECMETVVEALGVSGVQSLWAPLMQLEAANARQLQWLAVLACWSALAHLHCAFHSSTTAERCAKQA